MSFERELLDLIQEAKIVYQSPATWDYKFDRIFGLWKNKIKPLMQENNLELNWCDPDCDYEDDVRAFMDALLCFATNLEVVEEYRQSLTSNQGD